MTSLVPRLLPSFCRILYSMRQEAGEEPGNEARHDHCTETLMNSKILNIYLKVTGYRDVIRAIK